MVTLTATVDQVMVHHQAMDTHQAAMGSTVDLHMDMARDLMGMEETRMVVDQAMATGKVMDTVVQVQVMATGKLKEDTVDQDIMEGIKIGMEDIVIWKRRKPRRMIQKIERKPLNLPEAWKQVRRKMKLLKLKALRSR